MAARETGNDPSEQTERVPTVMKRRGILAAAGAAVAALVAKQASQSVAANSGGGDQGPFVLGSNNYYRASGGANIANISSVATVLEASPNYGNFTANAGHHVLFVDARPAGNTLVNGIVAYATGSVGVGVTGTSDTGAGVNGISTNSIGVNGTSTGNLGVLGTSIGSIGVYGQSNGNNGIYGNTNAPTGSGKAGVSGQGNGNGTFGVYGNGYSGTGVGVQGQSNDAGGVGVQGVSASGFPIIGKATDPTNPAAGVLGAGTKGPGVQGQSTSGHGLVGTTNATDGHAGLIGNANNAGGVGLVGIAPGYGTMSVGQAGIFYGNLKVYGTTSAPVQSVEVKHAGDNTYRLLHTVVSPEGWVEDFGEAKFTTGTADVKLDPDFAALVETSGYHVFLTEYDDHNNLFVTKRSASGFVVQAKETANLAGVKAPTKAVNGTFGYRVVAKRKDIAGERLAKVAAPTTPKVPTAFTIPETPVAKTPEVKAPTVTP